jgi:hypothetical protein
MESNQNENENENLTNAEIEICFKGRICMMKF